MHWRVERYYHPSQTLPNGISTKWKSPSRTLQGLFQCNRDSGYGPTFSSHTFSRYPDWVRQKDWLSDWIIWLRKSRTMSSTYCLCQIEQISETTGTRRSPEISSLCRSSLIKGSFLSNQSTLTLFLTLLTPFDNEHYYYNLILTLDFNNPDRISEFFLFLG